MVRLLPPERDIGVLRAPVRSCLALTAIFVLVLLSVGLLERIGIDGGAALTAVIGSAFALFALAALMSHSRRATDFYVADRKISGAFGGLAGAASFAGLLAIGLAGGAFATKADFLVASAGMAIGYVILAIFIAPKLRSFGAYTPGDFLAARFGGFWARIAWAIIAFSVSFLLLVSHLKIAGPLIATLFAITPEHAFYMVAAFTLVAALPGGMRSLTWTLAIEYFVIALACLVPVGFLAIGAEGTENSVAQNFGSLLIANLPPLQNMVSAQSISLVVLMAVGIASLPHLTARALTTPSSREAGTSMVWAVLFAAVLFAASIILVELLPEIASEPVLGSLPQLAALLSALPAVLAGLVLAGALAALFGLGQSALASAAAALSHDVYDEIVDRRGPEGRRIIVARIILIGIAAGATALAPSWQAEPGALLQWALALAAAGCFAPTLFGLWWRRCNEIGAIGGMVAGFGFTGLVFLMAQKIVPTAMVSSDWAEIGAPAGAIVGLLMSIAVTIGLSLVTPAPEADAKSAMKAGEGGGAGSAIRERPA